jgi:hypothetical protein
LVADGVAGVSRDAELGVEPVEGIPAHAGRSLLERAGAVGQGGVG